MPSLAKPFDKRISGPMPQGVLVPLKGTTGGLTYSQLEAALLIQDYTPNHAAGLYGYHPSDPEDAVTLPDYPAFSISLDTFASIPLQDFVGVYKTWIRQSDNLALSWVNHFIPEIMCHGRSFQIISALSPVGSTIAGVGMFDNKILCVLNRPSLPAIVMWAYIPAETITWVQIGEISLDTQVISSANFDQSGLNIVGVSLEGGTTNIFRCTVNKEPEIHLLEFTVDSFSHNVYNVVDPADATQTHSTTNTSTGTPFPINGTFTTSQNSTSSGVLDNALHTLVDVGFDPSDNEIIVQWTNTYASSASTAYTSSCTKSGGVGGLWNYTSSASRADLNTFQLLWDGVVIATAKGQTSRSYTATSSGPDEFTVTSHSVSNTYFDLREGISLRQIDIGQGYILFTKSSRDRDQVSTQSLTLSTSNTDQSMLVSQNLWSTKNGLEVLDSLSNTSTSSSSAAFTPIADCNDAPVSPDETTISTLLIPGSDIFSGFDPRSVPMPVSGPLSSSFKFAPSPSTPVELSYVSAFHGSAFLIDSTLPWTSELVLSSGTAAAAVFNDGSISFGFTSTSNFVRV